MKIFSRLFREAPPSPATLETPDRILSVAMGNDTDDLRVAAIDKLPYGDSLRELARLSVLHDKAAVSPVPAVLERAAQIRIAQLIDSGAVDFAEFCTRAENRSAMFAVAALCKGAECLPQALASVAETEQVEQLVVESPSSRLRQLAAQRIENPEQLRRLIRQVRSKDKSVYKILKQKCDALNAQDRKLQELSYEVNALCESLERHSHRTYDALYEASFAYLATRWLAFADQPEPSIQRRAQQAISRCHEVVAAREQWVAQQEAQRIARQEVDDAQARANQEAQAAAVALADLELQERREAQAARAAEEALAAEKRTAEEQYIRQIGGLIHKSNGALKDGNTQRAAGLRRAIEEKLQPGVAVAPAIARQLQQLDEKLNQLKQWKDYAVAPKRTELIEEMESLVGSSEEPRVLADRIKSLQEDWRTISKGIVSEAPEEWERFHQASQAAYQPCREYFEAQAKQRQENLEKRKVLLDRLVAVETTHAAENADWRLIGDVLREAPQEWRRYFPVDRDDNRPVQLAFDASLERLQAQLDAWHERNIAVKLSLIQRARHLLNQDDGREAIEAIKRLQVQWKEAGAAPRAQEQSLWSEFREVCDAIYQKRQQAYAQYAAGLEANKMKAAALCELAEQVAALSGQPLLEGIGKIAEWRAAFEALEEMPRAEARALKERFERAIDSCKAQMSQQKTRDADQAVANLFEAARQLQAYEWAITRDAEASELETAKQAAENFVASTKQWPKGALKTVKELLAKIGAVTDAELLSREKALRTLCIRREIHCEVPTPPEDDTLRREYQVQRLMQAMGQGNRGDGEEWDAMTLEWIRIGAIEPNLHESLQQRFLRCADNRNHHRNGNGSR
jgi:Domain of Unknown Function (DUF349)